MTERIECCLPTLLRNSTHYKYHKLIENILGCLKLGITCLYRFFSYMRKIWD